MTILAKHRLRIEKDVIIRIYKTLKGKGSLNISVDQEVTPADIIGTSQISSGFRTINLAKSLSVPPKEVIKYLRRSLGQRIYKGELLASKDGWLGRKKIILSPTDGILDFLNSQTGELRMTFLPKKLDLLSGVYGRVEQVDHAKGRVIIRTQASLIHGMFGSGKLRDGIIHIISRRDELVGKNFISPKLDEQILVGGSLIFHDAITSAISAGISALITGGINAKDYQSISNGRLSFPQKLENDIGISLVICEGFGSIPIGEDIHQLLSLFDGRYALVDGNAGIISLPSFTSSSLIRIKKNRLPPLPEGTHSIMNEQNLQQTINLKTGQRVRITGNSYPGQQGKIISLDQTATLLPSGIKTILATIETRTRKIKIPVFNIEVISEA